MGDNWGAGKTENEVNNKKEQGKGQECKEEKLIEEKKSNLVVKLGFWIVGILFMLLPLFAVPFYKILNLANFDGALILIKEVFYKGDTLVVSMSILFSAMQEIMLGDEWGIKQKLVSMSFAIWNVVLMEVYTISAIHFYYSEGGNTIFLFWFNVIILSLSIITCLFYYMIGKRGQ